MRKTYNNPHTLRRPTRHGALLNDNLIPSRHLCNPPRRSLDISQIRGIPRAHTLRLCGRVHRHKDQIGLDNPSVDIGGEEEVATTALLDYRLETRLVNGEVWRVPGRDARGVDVHNRDDDVRVLERDYGAGGTAWEQYELAVDALPIIVVVVAKSRGTNGNGPRIRRCSGIPNFGEGRRIRREMCLLLQKKLDLICSDLLQPSRSFPNSEKRVSRQPAPSCSSPARELLRAPITPTTTIITNQSKERDSEMTYQHNRRQYSKSSSPFYAAHQLRPAACSAGAVEV